jgi:hypothetical protein
MISLFRLNYTPQPSEQPYLSRIQNQSDEHAEISIAILTSLEAKQILGVPLANRGLQAIWVRVKNKSENGTRLLMTKIARDYFTAREAAGVCHFSILKRLLAFGFAGWFLLPLVILALPFKLYAVRRANEKMNACFQQLSFPLKNIAPGTTSEGIVFAPRDFGTKVVDVALVMNMDVKEYRFSVDLVGPKVDHQLTLAPTAASEEKQDLDIATLLHKLRGLPATTTNALGGRTGDPVNLAVIGQFATLIGVFAPRWDQTEIITLGSCWRTFKSFLTGAEYRYSPVSALYLFSRPQDFALQRVRDSINERIHLRLWSTSWLFQGQPVWVGQISRDIGVRFTWKTWNLTTHRIDSDVDEARDYVMEDLFESGRLLGGGYLPGVGACTRENPRHNLTGDPYFTDGNRAVLMVSEEKTLPKIFQWA